MSVPVFEEGPLYDPQPHQQHAVDLADGEGPLHAVEQVEEFVRERWRVLLGGHALVHQRDDHGGGHEADHRVQERHRRLAPLRREVGARGGGGDGRAGGAHVGNGDVDHLVAHAVEPLGRRRAVGLGLPPAVGQVPVGVSVGQVAVPVRGGDVRRDPQRLQPLQQLPPAVGRHQLQRRRPEVGLGEPQEGGAVCGTQGLAVLLHALLAQPPQHVLLRPLRHVLHHLGGREGQGGGVCRRRRRRSRGDNGRGSHWREV